MDFVYRKKENVSIVEAGMIKRLLAFIIDFVIFSGLSFIILTMLGLFNVIPSMYAQEIFALRTNIYEAPEYFKTFSDVLIHLIISFFFISYFAIQESDLVWGQSIGKKILSINVVDHHGNELSLVKSYIRNSTKYFLRVPYIGIPFGLFELALIFITSKRTGDALAGTIVASSISEGTYTDVEKGDKFYSDEKKDEKEESKFQ